MQNQKKAKSTDVQACIIIFLSNMSKGNWIDAHSRTLARFDSQTVSEAGLICHRLGFIAMSRGRVILTEKGRRV